MRRIVIQGCLAFVCLGAFAQDAATTAAPTEAKELDVTAKGAWVDTMLDVRPGDVLAISATGTVSVRNGKNTSKVAADGAARGFRDLLKSYPVNEAGQGALIGRVGSSETATPFLVGASKTWT